ncbi:hypothetical protein AB7952_07900 [Streptomyces sp. PG2]
MAPTRSNPWPSSRSPVPGALSGATHHIQGTPASSRPARARASSARSASRSRITALSWACATPLR